ncbi:MAG TPA: alpha-L-rhamnosidase C-terminal domain-containing protein [Terriglobia bacterium]|nr:alpha-L-rhamnosidase C-terminal domain-containing protein [Terriglobia bacterium]
MRRFVLTVTFLSLLPLISLNLPGQAAAQGYGPTPLDLTAGIKSPKLESQLHESLPEQYIWTQGSSTTGRRFWSPTTGNTPQWLYFRRSFQVPETPQTAYLYVAGPERFRIYLNGQLISNAQQDPTARIHPFVFSLDVSHSLRAGRNVLALAAARGRKLAIKIVPQPLGLNGPALLTSGPGWKYSTQEQSGWEKADFNDQGWRPVGVLGGMESNIDLFQANQDAGLYRWPGYDGISPFLARVPVQAAATLEVFPGLGSFQNTSALATAGDQLSPPTAEDFTVNLPAHAARASESPSLVLDFGRELTGRLEVISDSNAPMQLSAQYGESLGEALREPYLGVDRLNVPPHATAYGPKSAFRYVKVGFLAGSSPLRFKTIRVDHIYYPVRYRGSFESSDPLLNRIWQVGAYTSHLCMQDDIWDASKRDRARWMGDLDVSGHVIDIAFADHFLMQQTMDHLIRDAGQPVSRDVNGIPGYSAFWVMGEADYYRHIGDRNYLNSIHRPLIQLLDTMAGELDDQNVFANPHHAWPFVDWSPGLAPPFFGTATRPIHEAAPNAQMATQFEFYAAFHEGSWLLQQIGDSAEAARFAARAQAVRSAALQSMLDPQTGTFGDRWQPNAMAIYSGLADPTQTQAIWQKVLSHQDKFRITPYYNFYVISAMATAGHPEAALQWIRQYWGGMIRRGATSLWEAYALGLPKKDYHPRLRADFGMGYFVSLAHGWSTGPTIVLTENILGIKPTSAGFANVTIRPDLAGLQWARGGEPTPRGPIKVDFHASSDGKLDATVDLPPGTNAAVSVPVTQGETTVQIDGHAQSGVSAEDGRRMVVHISHAGHYVLTSR